MHRVELKVHRCVLYQPFQNRVPNAPCGVERLGAKEKSCEKVLVPNAPCGVESSLKQGEKSCH